MKRLAVVLTVVSLAICAATAVYGDQISLLESWNVTITSFSLGSDTGFHQSGSLSGSSTALIEPGLSVQIGDSTFGSLVFDFHAGQASSSDSAFFYPLCTLGTEWTDAMSFDWSTNISDARVSFSVKSADTTWWSLPSGSGLRTGHATFSAGTVGEFEDPPRFLVSFAPVPEPSALASIAVGLSGFGCLLNRRRRLTLA